MWLYEIKMPDCDRWIEIAKWTYDKYLLSGTRQVRKSFVKLYDSQTESTT